jgi:exosome complex exonuclease RRP6
MAALSHGPPGPWRLPTHGPARLLPLVNPLHPPPQCDFGLYLVNMFDTGQAARVLAYPSCSLAYLLQRFCGVVADKRHQLADWRVRPLSAEQIAYARADTHYLLYIHDALKRELAAASETLPAPSYAIPLREGAPERGALGVVLERSRVLCLSLYSPPSSREGAALEAAQRWGLALPPAALSVLRALWVWRDTLARRLDESPGYILPKAQLIGLARTSPGWRTGQGT